MQREIEALRKEKAQLIEENKKLAEKSGNKLTQMVTDDGNLVGLRSKMSDGDEEEEESQTMTVDEIKKELFESDDVVMDKNNDRGLSRLTERQG